MAMIITGESRCSICDEVIQAGQDITATSGGCFPRDHHLWHHCDAGMHWDCFWSWPHRREFSRGYVEAWIQGYQNAYAAALVYSDEDCVVMIEPAKRATKAEESGASADPLIHVFLWSTKGRCLLKASEWREWAVAPVSDRPQERAILQTVCPRLAALYPDPNMLLVDLDVKAHIAKQIAFLDSVLRAPNPPVSLIYNRNDPPNS
jgi:hypothetical protein